MFGYVDDSKSREGTKRPKDAAILYMILGVVLVLTFILINIFLHRSSCEESCYSLLFLLAVPGAAFVTGLVYRLVTHDLNEPIRDTTRGCAVGTAVSAMFMLFAVLLELGTDEGFSLYQGKEIQLWFFSIEKKYFYDLFAVVWYPYNLSVILSALRKERFHGSSVFYSCIAVMGSTLSGILIFRPMSNIYSIDLVVLNTITLAVGLWKYAIPEKTVRKGNVITAVVLYAVMRIILLPLQCSNWEPGYGDFIKAIQVITSNAPFFGTSEYLKNAGFVNEYLASHRKPMLQLLYYFGWSSVIVMVLLLALFVFVILKLAGLKNGREHRRWLIFATAAAMFAIRAVMGFLYSFGVRYPIKLPFMGNEGSIMDSMAFTLLLICAWENRKIRVFHLRKDGIVSSEQKPGAPDDPNGNIQKEIISKYAEDDRPDCMESEVSYFDEEEEEDWT